MNTRERAYSVISLLLFIACAIYIKGVNTVDKFSSLIFQFMMQNWDTVGLITYTVLVLVIYRRLIKRYFTRTIAISDKFLDTVDFIFIFLCLPQLCVIIVRTVIKDLPNKEVLCDLFLQYLELNYPAAKLIFIALSGPLLKYVVTFVFLLVIWQLARVFIFWPEFKIKLEVEADNWIATRADMYHSLIKGAVYVLLFEYWLSLFGQTPELDWRLIEIIYAAILWHLYILNKRWEEEIIISGDKVREW
jgi:hypothetical protein